MKIVKRWLIIVVLQLWQIMFDNVDAVTSTPSSQQRFVNRPPRFVIGGDMAQFSLPEDVEVGSTIYKLRGTDDEGSSVYFSISGEYFTVNKYTGDVTLIKKLDREANNTVEVVISITDESTNGGEANTISLRREIPIIDINDNYPTFSSAQYSFSIKETARVGTIVYDKITIEDGDFGLNALVNLFCVQSLDCRTFAVSLQIMSEGFYKATVTLIRPLNYETQSSYSLWLKAIDSNPKNSLSTMAKVIIDVQDIQDQPPVFFNTPYSISIYENTPPNQNVLTVKARDGDVQNQRPVIFSIEQDVLKYFAVENHGNGTASIVTTNNQIDREDPLIVQMGGICTFYVKATELINDQISSDESKELVTIVILDRDDQLPKFNKPVFVLNVSEDIGIGTPLPGFGMVISDEDIGENAHFSLSLRTEEPEFADCFTVEPFSVIGQSPVIIRIMDNVPLDYDNGVREVRLNVVAFITDEENIPQEVSSSEVILNIIDANDNFPQFSRSSFVVNVTENTPTGTRVAKIIATDRDSGLFAQISYSVGGFGSDIFDTDAKDGGLILVGQLDYEQQISYSLTLIARDGGNQTTTAEILVNVIDANDNPPIFEFPEYRRNIRENSIIFQPQFFLKATDADGPRNNKIIYSVHSANSDAVTVDPDSGELIMTKLASSQDTSRGQYELKIQANDSGIPSLSSLTQVFIRVGMPGNQRPVFQGLPYNITIFETLSPKSFITTVRATDPDGPDDLIEYKITAGADNFYMKSKSGKIYLSENADLKSGKWLPKKYSITVLAVDSGVPFRETAQTTVTVNVVDINNEPPLFQRNVNYISHISEDTPIGSVVMKVQADDPDKEANIGYSILKPYKFLDKRGFLLKDVMEDYKQLLEINEKTGEITLRKRSRNPLVHVITITIEARDKNAVENIEKQIDRVEATFFVESSDELKPIFSTGGWTRSNPIITYDMREELPIGSTVLSLIADDPVTMLPVTTFQTKSLPRQLAMDPLGNVVLTERIDYETITNKKLSFVVEALSRDTQRQSEARVIINILDINDHVPRFEYEDYRGSVEENSKKGNVILVVKASDGDLPSSPKGYGNVSYTLTGEHAFLFDIDPMSGEIKVGNVTIDREKQVLLNLVAVAVDTPSGGKDRRKAEVPIQIDVLDVNDNEPTFKDKEYSVVMLENVPVGSSVVNVSATDPDIGLAGLVIYEIVNEFDNFDLFMINSTSGEIKVKQSLTGRGRMSPYILMVRAQDNGVPSLFSDVQVNVLVGDVVLNDGIPMFVRPTENEIAYILEDVPIGSPVFHVIGTDPDDPYTPEGQIHYSLLRDSSDVDAFSIDSRTGLITTRQKFDREMKNKYSLIVLIRDNGLVPQQVTRTLKVHINDTDDNVPLFERAVDEKPLQMAVHEESKPGTTVGIVQARDLDEERNAQIAYLIIDGNGENLFSINDNVNGSGIIKINGRIDREKVSHFLLTVKCFKKRELPRSLYKSYNKNDFSERQVFINVLDIDDNVPHFSQENITTSVRFNVPIDYLITTVEAYDDDAQAELIHYSLISGTYSSLKTKLGKSITPLPFEIIQDTGELRTNSTLLAFVDGYFDLEISASSGPSLSYSSMIVKVYVIRERGLLGFVFSKTPTEVREYLPLFKTELENVLAIPSMKLNVFETRFYSKEDGSVDFSKTSSCFQIITDDYGSKETESMFEDENNEMLREIYEKYSVQSVQRCGNYITSAEITWVQISLLSIAVFIGFTSIISTCVLCCSYSKWQRLR